MADAFTYTQFSTFQEHIFGFYHSITNSSTQSQMHQSVKVGILLSCVRTVFEIIQVLPVLTRQLSLQCYGSTADCVLGITASPSVNFAILVGDYTGAIVSSVFLLMLTIVIILCIAYRKRRSNSTATTQRIIDMCLACVLGFLLLDHLVFWIGKMSCHRFYEDDQILELCPEATDVILLVVGIIVVLVILIFTHFLYLFSSTSQFCVSSSLQLSQPISTGSAEGKLSTSSIEILFLWFKVYLAAVHIILQHKSEIYIQIPLRILTLLISGSIFILQLLRAPFILSVANRLRAFHFGCIFGFSVCSVCESCGLDINLFGYFMAGVICGCIGFAVAPWRSYSLSHLCKLDMNAMSSMYDPMYIHDLLLVHWDDSLYADNTQQQSQNNRINFVSGQSATGGSKSSTVDQGMSATNRSPPRRFPSFNSSPTKAEMPPSPFDHLNESVNKNVPSVNLNDQNEIVHNKMNNLIAAYDEKMVFPALTGHEAEMAGKNEAKSRLLAYLDSQNFSSIRRVMLFPSDIELIVRSSVLEWHELSNAQRELAKVTLCQIFVALMQQAHVPALVYFWFAVTCLQLLSDSHSCLRAVRLAAEASTSISTNYQCYCLQKIAEAVRAGDNQRRTRRDGITDQAAYRRWASTAQLCHDKAIVSMRKFFRSFGHDGRGIRNKDLKVITDRKRLLKLALDNIYKAEEAHRHLKMRFPQVEEAQLMASMFKLQFFHEEAITERSKDASTEGSLSSLGGGASGESPKDSALQQIKLQTVKTFKWVRVATWVSLFIIAGVLIVFTVVNIIQLDGIAVSLSEVADVSSLFIALPRMCAYMRRITIASQIIKSDYLDYIDTYGPDLKIGVEATKESTTSTQVETLCNYAISNSDGNIIGCGVYLSNFGLNTWVEELADGTFSSNADGIPFLYIGNPVPSDVNAPWISEVYRRMTANEMQRDSYYNLNIDTSYVRINTAITSALRKFSVSPILFNSAEQGFVVFEGLYSDFDEIFGTWMSPMQSYLNDASFLQEEFMKMVLDSGVDSLIDITHSSNFPLTIYNTELVGTDNFYPYNQIIPLVLTSFQETHDILLRSQNYTQIDTKPNFRLFIKFCSDSTIDDLESIVHSVVDYIHMRIAKSTSVVSGCAAAALVCCFIGLIVTVRIVKTKLDGFDRDDGYSLSLSIFSNFPRSEIKRLIKNSAALRLDKGILDPDDDDAAQQNLLRAVFKLRVMNRSSSSVSSHSFIGHSAFSDLSQRTHDLNHVSLNGLNKKDDIESNTHNSQINNSYNHNMNNNNSYNKNKINSNYISSLSPNNLVEINSQHPMSVVPFNPKKKMFAQNLQIENVNDNETDGFKHVNKCYITSSSPSPDQHFIHSPKKELVNEHSYNNNLNINNNINIMNHSTSSVQKDPSMHSIPAENIPFVGFKAFGAGLSDHIPSPLRDNSAYQNDDSYELKSKHDNLGDVFSSNSSADHFEDIEHQKDSTTSNLILVQQLPIPSDIQKYDSYNKINKLPSKENGNKKKNYKNNQDSMSMNNNVTDARRVKIGYSAEEQLFEIRDDTTFVSSSSSRKHSHLFNTCCGCNCGPLGLFTTKSIRGFFRRQLSLTFVFVWLMVGGFVTAFLVIGISSLEQFQEFYDEVESINISRYDNYVFITQAIDIVFPSEYPWRGISNQEFLERYYGSLLSSKSIFQDVLTNPKPSGETAGRRYESRSDLLYDSYVCLPDSKTEYAASTCASRVEQYTGQLQMTRGLYRSMLYFYEQGENLYFTYKDIGTTTVAPVLNVDDSEHWWLADSMFWDVSEGLEALRSTFLDEAGEMIIEEKNLQWSMLAGAVSAIAVSIIIVELVMKGQKKELRNTLTVLRILPARILFDYRVFERIFGIKSEDELSFDNTQKQEHADKSLFYRDNHSIKKSIHKDNIISNSIIPVKWTSSKGNGAEEDIDDDDEIDEHDGDNYNEASDATIDDEM